MVGGGDLNKIVVELFVFKISLDLEQQQQQQQNVGIIVQ